MTGGTGTVAGADVTGIQVTCAVEPYVAGTVTGLVGVGLRLASPGLQDLEVDRSDTRFAFQETQPAGSIYRVTVVAQPVLPAQICEVANGEGIMGPAGATDVAVTCRTIQWTMAAGGSFHSLALKGDGSLWGWGQNGWGEVGDGSVDPAPRLPVEIGAGFAAVAAGRATSAALKQDGTLWTWGSDVTGQLGGAGAPGRRGGAAPGRRGLRPGLDGLDLRRGGEGRRDALDLGREQHRLARGRRR